MARGRFTFWLDYSKDRELLLADTIDELKRKRTFVPTIRDGIRLICDLRAGKLDVLFELFPWVRAEFLVGIQPQKATADIELQRQLERLEQHMLALGSRKLPNDAQKPLQAITVDGPRALNAPKFDLPRFDDDDDMETLVIAKDTNTDSALNFVNSMMRLQQ